MSQFDRVFGGWTDGIDNLILKARMKRRRELIEAAQRPAWPVDPNAPEAPAVRPAPPRKPMDAIRSGVEQLRRKWPQAHAVPGADGSHLVFLPTFALAKGYDATVCTALFIAPPYFPTTAPTHFFTDIEIRLKNGAQPHYTSMNNTWPIDRLWPQWAKCQRWHWIVQGWNPNHSSLFTYAMVIRNRLNLAL